jgi:hypothetical protein
MDWIADKVADGTVAQYTSSRTGVMLLSTNDALTVRRDFLAEKVRWKIGDV